MNCSPWKPSVISVYYRATVRPAYLECLPQKHEDVPHCLKLRLETRAQVRKDDDDLYRIVMAIMYFNDVPDWDNILPSGDINTLQLVLQKVLMYFQLLRVFLDAFKKYHLSVSVTDGIQHAMVLGGIV